MALAVWPGKPKFFHILPTLHLDYLVIALPRAVLPRMITAAFGNKSSFVVCSVAEGVKGILVFLTSPLIGVLADTYGRKPLMLFCVLATALPMCLLAFIDDIWMYILITPISGLGSATFSVVFAYIADLVPVADRASAYGTAIGVGMGLAFVVGPTLGGHLATAYGHHVVFLLCLALTCGNLLYTSLYLGESFDVKNSPAFDLVKANPLQSVGTIFASPVMRRLAVITLLYYTAIWGVIGNLLIYATSAFNFTPKESGLLLSWFGALNALVQAVGVRELTKHCSDFEVLQLGLCGGILMLVTLGVAWDGWMLFLGMAFAACSMLTFTAVSSLTSSAVSSSKQAEAQGAIHGVKALTEGVGPLLTGISLAACEGTRIPGLPFCFSALLCAAALWVSYGLAKLLGPTHTQKSSDPEEVTSVPAKVAA